MKKIIAIFSVMLTFGLMLPTDGWSGGCRPHDCGSNHTDADKVWLSDINKCFFCQNGHADEDQCDGGHIVVTASNDLYVCNDNSSDTWSQITNLNSAKLSNGSLNLAAKGTTNTEYCWVQSRDSDICSKNVSVAKVGNNASDTEVLAADIFLYIYCINGTVPAADRKSCISPNYDQVCSDSHGQWNNNTCTCDSDLGLENTDPNVPSSPCKCSDSSHIWNGAKCDNPDRSIIEACENQPSGGEWLNGKCDCTGVEPAKKPSQDEKTCVENTKFTDCDNSHGDWNGGANGTCTCDETNKGLVLRGEVCVCKDSNAIWYDQFDRCDTSPRALCEGSGGAFEPSQSDPNNGICNCEADSDKNLKKKTGVTPDRCICKNDDYDWKTRGPNRDGCVLTDEARNRIQTYDDLKGMCEKWQGSWYPENYEDDRNPNNWECTCPTVSAGVKQSGKVNCQCAIDEGYMREVVNSKYVCEQSTCGELKTLCESATDENNNSGVAERWPRDAVSDGDACYCKCKDSNKFYDKGQNKCIVAENPMVEICRLYGAIVGKNDNCVCEESGLPPEKGKICSPSTSNGNASSGTVATVTDTSDKEENIKTLYVQLTSISDGFKKSHWKTASGNFNGARLASDSIAGVVLGTVGGVVTSNVIKKNQVKGGFESLQCTVGGQFVADFADQFQVGIR